jgi:hypothetical protein
MDKDSSIPASYCPITLTSALAKTTERMVNLRLEIFLERENIIDGDQAGFRKNRSSLD